MGGSASSIQDFRDVSQLYEKNKDQMSDAEMLNLLKSNIKGVPDNLFYSVDYDAVRADILRVMNDPAWDDGTYGPLFIRLAWHSSGTYDKDTKTGIDPPISGTSRIHVP
jgi:catalase (peroxidase I)